MPQPSHMSFTLILLKGFCVISNFRDDASAFFVILESAILLSWRGTFYYRTVTVQYPSQLLLKSILNRLWRWILALLNHFLTVSAVNALTCWTVTPYLFIISKISPWGKQSREILEAFVFRAGIVLRPRRVCTAILPGGTKVPCRAGGFGYFTDATQFWVVSKSVRSVTV